MAAYATADDVKARAGRAANTFGVAGKRPNETDLEKFLIDVSAEIDSLLRGRGHDPAALPAGVAAALRDLAAYGALYRALPGVDMSDRPDETKKLLDTARRIWEGGTKALAEGTLPALAQLEAAGGSSAGDFWTDHPAYPTTGDVEEARTYPSLAPGMAKGMSL